MKNRFISLLALLLICALTLPMVSCAPPALDEVKDIFVDLINRSENINRILFGDGLAVYGDMKYDEATKTYYTLYYHNELGKVCAYYDSASHEYKVVRYGAKGEGETVFENEEKGIYLYATDLVYTDNNKNLPDALLPTGYKFVRDDEVCTSINDITALASTVYSEGYLADVFEATMGISGSDEVISNETLTAKYTEMTDSETGKKYLLRADHNVCEPQVSYTRIYDFSSMVIAKNSRATFVNVEILSYGPYADVAAGETKIGWSTTRLAFVKQDGEWRLDTPTY